MKNKLCKYLAAISITLLCLGFTALAETGPGMNLRYKQSGTGAGALTTSAKKEAHYPLTAADVTAQDTDAEREALLRKSKTALLTDQIILVVDHNLTLWDKNADGSFTKQMDVYCGYGKNGMKPAAERVEGDGTTPIGTFPILFAFGFGENPGTALTWRSISPDSYWSGEKASYNTWVESSKRIAGEHLSEYTICYKKALAIGFNQDPVVYGRGSAIFLHIKNPATWSSAGCVSVEESNMTALLAKCHDGVRMIIVPEQSDIASY